jgi:hypothetical protein
MRNIVMLSILQPEPLRAAQLTLIASVGAVTSGRRISAYVHTLNALQRYPIPFSEGERSPCLDFELNDPAVRWLLSELSGDNQVEVFSAAEQLQIRDKVKAGLQRLRVLDPSAEDAVRFLIPRLVFARHALRAGGSAANAVGMVWLSPLVNASVDDYAEFLWHEATHQALFLAEMIQPLFTVERRNGPMPQITSAIRRKPRDYDLAFHAACVAASLIELHQALGNQDRVAELRHGLSLTVSELLALQEPLAPAGRAILQELVALDRAALPVPIDTIAQRAPGQSAVGWA